MNAAVLSRHEIDVDDVEYLRHGDIIEAGVATDDGAIDLGVQRTAVKYA